MFRRLTIAARYRYLSISRAYAKHEYAPILESICETFDEAESVKMTEAYRSTQKDRVNFLYNHKGVDQLPKDCLSTLETPDVTNILSLETSDHNENIGMIATSHYKKGEITIWSIESKGEQENVHEPSDDVKKYATGSFRMDYTWHMSKFLNQDYLLSSYPYPGFKVINWRNGKLESNVKFIQPGPLSEGSKNAMLGFATDYCIIGCRNGSVSFYNRTQNKLIRTISNLHTNYVRSLQYLPSLDHFVSAGMDGNIHIIDISSGKVVRSIQAHSHWVSSITSLDENTICTTSGDKTARIWNVATGELLHSLESHTGRINQVLFLGGDYIATASDDKYIFLWDWKKGVQVGGLVGHKDHVKNIILMSNNRIVSSSLDGTMKVWGIKETDDANVNK
ncbi:hypothetical protein AKO1_005909 [Acrasis kona]|uniref:Anaphase-promoting complex subunit 4-like WD40 domain-containing protein n=1 Tax=Acrasis kona TaxID=1008807 RepID=A0AAW2YIF1_9EUKA